MRYSLLSDVSEDDLVQLKNTPILEMRDIHVKYQESLALKGVDFSVLRGEVHALVGDHRAGKSTLVKVLSGAIRKQSGQIYFNGKKINNLDPLTAIKIGIGIVYQDIYIVPTMNAVENIFIGSSPKTWSGKIDFLTMYKKTKELFDNLKVSIDLNCPLWKLGRGDQYMVELARALMHKPRLLIFDEISGKLRPEEMELIYPILEEYKKQNLSVIYISHNMDEIFKIADRVTILRKGYRQGTERVRDLDRMKLLKMTYAFVLSREDLEKDNIQLYYFKKYNEEIIKNLPIGVIIVDAEMNLYLINYSAVKILNLDTIEPIQKSITELLKMVSISEKEDIISRINNREIYVWKNVYIDENTVCKVSMYPFQDEDYHFLGTILLLEDITKDHFLNEYLVRTDKITSIGELAAGVAHEINNPLSIIQNYIELIKITQSEDANQENLEKIEREIDRIVGIVGNLLSFSRWNELPDVIFNFCEIIDEVIELLAYPIKEKEINFIKNLIDKPLLIEGCENRIKQVIINIIMNSIEAVSFGGTIQLDLTYHKRKGSSELSITDNGYGIPPDIINLIFDPFFSTKTGKKNTGLGLSICQHIIELHKGWISCNSTPGKRTVFTIRLPLAEPCCTGIG